jgi:hypothetical protein
MISDVMLSCCLLQLLLLLWIIGGKKSDGRVQARHGQKSFAFIGRGLDVSCHVIPLPLQN